MKKDTIIKLLIFIAFFAIGVAMGITLAQLGF